jgi:hypothetical protein
MKIKYFLVIIFFLVFLSSCSLREGIELLLWLQRYSNEVKEVNEIREVKEVRQEERLTLEEAERQSKLYWAISFEDVERVKQYLEEGYDPNRCRGEQGWIDRTPLDVVARSFYTTYVREISGEKIPDPPPDVEMLQLLVEAGADVNRRPYIWCIVHHYENSYIELLLRNNVLRDIGKRAETEAEKEIVAIQNIESAKSCVKDGNRVIEAFLKAGADPDKLGHPYPYSLEAKRKRITDEEADEYFAKGTRPINEAIKKGMWWESQVDLLLQYTTLDEDSLKAAEESNDPAMIEKITKLWN